MNQKTSTLVELLKARAASEPEQEAYTFLLGGETEETKLSYGELDRRARAIAARLQAEGVSPGARALLLFPPGIDFVATFFGCLHAGVVAVPAYPPRANRNLARLAAIVDDARPAAVLTTGQLLAKVETMAAHLGPLANLVWIPTDRVDLAGAELWREPELSGDSLAFLQYTSGSTSLPKGVMVSHGNLLHNEGMIQEAFAQSPESVIVSWLPLYHDMGLIGTVLQPLYLGARCILMSPLAFLQQPVRWLSAISRYRATTSGGPNFAYELAALKISEEEKAGLDLSCWTVAFNGAEPVRAETLERFSRAFQSRGFNPKAFYPCYGLAEATLLVTGGAVAAPPTVHGFDAAALERNEVAPGGDGESCRRLVGSGHAWQGQELLVVDPESRQPCPPGRVGEIWVRGPSVARGYWRRPEETEHTFGARLAEGAGADGVDPAGQGGYLRTGDLGFLHAGELFVTGRLKDLIIVRGRNLYPQDIELSAERAHPALRVGCGAAFSVEVDGEERLIVVQELDRRGEAAASDAAEAIRQAVAAEHEVPPHEVVLIRAGSLPKTSSGKVQRRACRSLYLAGKLARLGGGAVETPVEAPEMAAVGDLSREELLALPAPRRPRVLGAWLGAEVARLAKIPPAAVDPERSLAALGFDSLRAVELRNKIEDHLRVDISLVRILEGMTLAELVAEALAGASRPTAAAELAELAPAGPTEGDHPLSHGQQALWYVEQLNPESSALNLSVALRMTVAPDLGILRRVIGRLTERHPALRTAFPVVDGEPVARVLPERQLTLVHEDVGELSAAELAEMMAGQACRPFDLAAEPLLRLHLWSRGPEDHRLLLTIHHIVADLWSLSVLMRELSVLYAREVGLREGARGPALLAPLLAPLPLRTTDFVRWQRQRLEGGRREALLAWWEEHLGTDLPALDLPTDRPRPRHGSGRGDSHAGRIDRDLKASLHALAADRGATLYTVLLAAFSALLGRSSGQRRFALGSPTEGRERSELAGLVGYFVNPVVLRADLSGGPSFTALVDRTRATALAAFAHRELPFPLLVERLAPERDPGRSPLFQALFVFQDTLFGGPEAAAFALGEAGARTDLGGLAVESLALPQRRVQFDLELVAAETGGGLGLSLRHATDLFDATTARRLLDRFTRLLVAAVGEPSLPVDELPLLAPAEAHQLRSEWNDTAVAGAGEIPLLPARIAARAAAFPADIALVDGGRELSYRQLAEGVRHLAHLLVARGLSPEDRVGIACPRRAEMVVAMLAVLEAGGAYVPLDPAYPAERLAFMAGDANIRILLTATAVADRLPALGAEVLLLDELPALLDARGPERALPRLDPAHLAWLIYTSGSTGKPKGVAITHGSAAALIAWALEAFTPARLARVLAATSISFDLSIFEIFATLAAGGTVVLADNALALPEVQGPDVPAAAGLTLVNTVPSAIAELARQGAIPASVATINLAGEALPRELVDRLHALGTVAEVWNLYGPSEDTTYSTWARIPPRATPPRGVGDGARPAIGRPIAGTRLHLLDPALRPVPLGVVGEICLAGSGLARGYLGRPGRTAEAFVPDPASPLPGGRLYRTGDLARHLPAGEVDFLGRRDHQVKVRGFRVELGEIEAALLARPEVAEAVVVAGRGAGSTAGNDRLIAYVAPAPGAEIVPEALRESLRESLPEALVPQAFVALPKLPLTPSGKIDRRALPDPASFLAAGAGGAGASAPPRTSEEATVAGVWAEVLGLPAVGVGESFFALGGHSLLAARITSRLRDATGVEVPLKSFLDDPTVAGIARLLGGAPATAALPALPAVQPAPAGADPVASFPQRRLWFLARLEPDSPEYNMPGALHLRGGLDVPHLAGALAGVVARHESLRTTFVEVDGEPRPVVAATLRIGLPLLDLSALPAARRLSLARELAAREARRPFDLAAGPLLRATLLRLLGGDGGEHTLLATLHHIVSDGWSQGVLVRELGVLYGARVRGEEAALPPLPVTCGDHAHWQQRQLSPESPDGGAPTRLAFWRELLGDGGPPLDLPLDRPRPPRRTHRGGRRPVALSPELVARARALGAADGATLYMVLLAAFQALLGRLAGQGRIAVGSPVANRPATELEGLIGFFVNTLVLPAELGDDPSFATHLSRVRATTLAAFAHGDLPFELLVEALAPERDLARSPLFQAMLVLANTPAEPPRLPGLVAELAEVDSGTAKFELTLMLAPRVVGDGSEGLGGYLEYNADLFDATTAHRFAGHFGRLLAAAARHPEHPLSTLPLLGPEEAHQLTVEANDSGPGRLAGATLHGLFLARAARTPEAPAVVSAAGSLTCGELAEASAALAGHLVGLGVGPEVRVGVLMERRPSLLVALLAVLRAGGAYVPVDPSYPAERRAFLLADSGAAVLLTTSDLAAKVPTLEGPAAPTILHLDELAPSPVAAGWEGPGEPALAYLIYTSGSTGRPKGVAIEHASAVAMVGWALETWAPEDLRAVLAGTSVCFDLSIYELFVPLAAGGRVLLATDALDLGAVPGAEELTLINTVPSAMAELVHLGAVPPSVRVVNLAGEPLRRSLVEAVYRTGVREVWNLYGPSEDTTYSTAARIPGGSASRPTIGRPIAGTRLHLVDRHLAPTPLGVPGELVLAGAGLARGYHGRPALTAERWVPDPFAPIVWGAAPETGEGGGGRLYRTGDLARRLPDGEIDFLGRLDHQVKIRGFRIELGEIEAALTALAGVDEAVVVAAPVGPEGEPTLVAYLAWNGDEGSEKGAAPALAAELGERLPRHLVPAIFVLLPALPRTPNGKIDRKALPAPERSDLAPERQIVPPRTATEAALVTLWGEILGVPEVSVDDRFFALGGHSLLATRLVSRLRKALGVEVPVKAVFETRDLAALAACVDALRLDGARGEASGAAASSRERPLLPVPRLPAPGEAGAGGAVDLPTSLAQERLWIMDRLLPGNPVYNIFQALELTGPLDRELLGRAFDEVVRRHESLRTVFPTVGGKVVQRIFPSRSGVLMHLDWTNQPAAERAYRIRRFAEEEARKPFDLAAGPLLRLTLVTLGSNEHILLVALHHIICDDWSMGVMIQEVAVLYRALAEGSPLSLPEPSLQVGDHAVWQREHLVPEVLAEKLAFWQEVLAPPLPVLELPADHPRPERPSFRGVDRTFALPAELSRALVRRAASSSDTLYMSLLTAFAAVLSQAAGQGEVVVGCPVANRDRLELEGLIGFFVNVVPLRIDLRGEPTWSELLARVRRTALDGFEHGDVPFEEIVRAVVPERDPSRAPVRQVAFAFEEASRRPIELAGGTRARALHVGTGAARLDLTLFMWQGEEAVEGVVEYPTDLFEADTIERFLASFEAALTHLVEGDERTLPRLPPLVPAARQEVEPERVAAVAAVTAVADSGLTAEVAKAGRAGRAGKVETNLTESQLLFWFAEHLSPDEQLYFDRAATTFTLEGELDRHHFERALQALVDRCDALRSVIVEEKGVPRRRVREPFRVGLEIVDLTDFPRPEKVFDSWLEKRAFRPFEMGERLFDCALVRLAPERWVWFWSVHHMVADGWSLTLIAAWLSTACQLSRQGRLAEAPGLPSFEDYVGFERSVRASERWEKAREYWEAKLAQPWTHNAFYRAATAPRTLRSERLSLPLGRERSEAIREVTTRLSAFSPAIVFATALFACLHRLSGERVLRCGAPFANRGERFKETVGLLMNACALEVEVEPGETFLSLARKVQRENVETARHQLYPVRNPPENPAWDVYLNYQTQGYQELCGLPVTFDLLTSGNSHNALEVQVRDFDASGCWTLDFDFNLAAFGAAERERTATHFLNLLDAFLANPEGSLAAAPMLSPEEREAVVVGLNETATPYERGLTLPGLFARQAAATPEATALVREEEHLSYRELARRANGLALALGRLGVGPDQAVGILAERSIEMVVGLFAILGAGGAYVPLDPSYPVERLAFMLEDAGLTALLASRELIEGPLGGTLGALLGPSLPTLFLEDGAAAAPSPEEGAPPPPSGAGVGEDHLAYMIFTSGSTGRPKGVMIPHRGIVNRLLWMQESYRLRPGDRVLQKTPASFDVSVWEFFWPLATGATLVVARPGGHQDPTYLVRTIAAERITTMHFVPSMLQVFVEQPGVGELGSLRRVITSGEALPEELRQRFYERVPGVLHNLYGPTEAAVDVTSWACPPENELPVLPIGKPIANTRIHLLDRYANPVPKGIPGELVIGGVQLARGYRGRPGLTARSFIPDGMGEIGKPGDRLYRTGDLARYLPDGEIEFLGRIDFQVKLRGFRIELGEIEAALLTHPAVREAVVLARDDRAAEGVHDVRLVAYVVPAGEAAGEAGAALAWSTLRSHLAEGLPEHMVPAAGVILPAMPLTPSGKVDRKALPAPDFEAAATVAWLAPRTPLEALVAHICAEVLGVAEVGVEHNFFEIGGNSLLATQVVTMVQDVLPVELPLRNVFETPTVARIAALIEEHREALGAEEKQLMSEILADFEALMAAETETEGTEAAEASTLF